VGACQRVSKCVGHELQRCCGHGGVRTRCVTFRSYGVKLASRCAAVGSVGVQGQRRVKDWLHRIHTFRPSGVREGVRVSGVRVRIPQMKPP
jgi:hypothetical protein